MGKTVLDPPPPWLTGEEILHERINNIKGLSKSVECGGNGHDNPSKTIFGYGVTHNWVNKSIFWELPYWENHLLRHSLDFMHIEKNFFDNLTNTVLNAPGKTRQHQKQIGSSRTMQKAGFRDERGWNDARANIQAAKCGKTSTPSVVEKRYKISRWIRLHI